MLHLRSLTWPMLVACAVVVTGTAHAQEARPDSIYAKLVRSVAFVETPSGDAGTAWIYDVERRLLVTNYHVVADSKAPSKTPNQQFVVHDRVGLVFPRFGADGRVVAERTGYAGSRLVPARVIDADSRRDLALLQADALPADARAIPLAAALPGPGDAVHSVGNPSVSTFLWVYNRGYVRQIGHKTWPSGRGVIFYTAAQVIETQSPTNPGDSGSPVVNDRGELVGVHHGGLQSHALVKWVIALPTFRQYVEETKAYVAPRSAAQLAHRARHYLDRDRLALAEADFRGAIAEFDRGDPHRASDDSSALTRSYCRAMLTDVLTRRLRFTEAMTLLDDLIQKDPKYGFAYALRARVRQRRPPPAEPFGMPLAELLSMMNKRRTVENDALLADALKAVELEPTNALAHEVLADFYHANGELTRPDAAREIEYRTKVIALRPRDFRAWLARARAYAEPAQFTGAAPDFARALADCDAADKLIRADMEHDWTNIVYRLPVLRQRSEYLVQLKNYRRAVADAQTICNLEPETPQNCFLLGQAQLGAGDFGLALGAYTKAIDLHVSRDQLPPRLYRVRRADAYAGLAAAAVNAKNTDRATALADLARKDYQAALQVPDPVDDVFDPDPDPDGVSAQAIRAKLGKLPAGR